LHKGAEILSFLAILDGLIAATAVAILISGLDDLLIDVLYWSRRLALRLGWQRQEPQPTAAALQALPERYLAIMVPAWKEADVIASMVENTLRTLDYQRYVVFLGTYRNDLETTAQADAMVQADPVHMVRAHVDRDGPTCKADCLNWIMRAIRGYEERHAMEFAGVVMHDCEDVVHPLELRYFNYRLQTADLVQLPVMSLELPWNSWVGGAYLDDFSESHQKDILVRQQLTGIVPGAGVALGYSRKVLEEMSHRHGGQLFNVDSLTEDYDFSFRLAEVPGMRQVFAGAQVVGAANPPHGRGATPLSDLWRRPATATGLLATCEYFPSTFKAAYRQRARWVLGISFLGWRQLGWRGSFWNRYLLYRDRKGLWTAPLSMLAYVLLLYTLAAQALGHGELVGRWLQQPWIQAILLTNVGLLANRGFQRMWFVTQANGLQHGLLSIPRMVFGNFINFAAVSRAWHQWLRHLATGVPIAWDKTQHTFPTSAALAHHRRRLGDLLVARGAISQEALTSALQLQASSGARLGQLLLEQGSVSPEALADAVAIQDELPRARRHSQPMPAAAASIDPALIRAHQVVPMAVDAHNTLEVAVASRPTPEVTRAIKSSSGLHVAYVVACDHEVRAWVDQLAPQPKTSGGAQ
jgi:adsorption protein B